MAITLGKGRFSAALSALVIALVAEGAKKVRNQFWGISF